MAIRIFRSATILAAAALAAAAFPALAEGNASASTDSGASQSAAASAQGGARFSETIGVATPQKRIVGTTHGSAAQGAEAEDDRILNKVVDALVRDPGMQGANIEVKVDSGNVTLDGRTRNAEQADHARDVAQDAAAGNKVTSKLSTSG